MEERPHLVEFNVVWISKTVQFFSGLRFIYAMGDCLAVSAIDLPTLDTGNWIRDYLLLGAQCLILIREA